MPYDLKYGDIALEKGTITDDEGVVVFRYRDKLILETMYHYLDLCKESGSPQHHLDLIEDTIEDIRRWQIDHQDRVVTPTSNSFLGCRES